VRVYAPLAALVSLVLLVGGADPAYAGIFSVVPANSAEDPADEIAQDDALLAIATTDLGGGEICVIPAVFESSPGNTLSCDDEGVGWASTNQITGIGTVFTPIQPPLLRLGTWRLLGDGQCLEYMDDVCLTPSTDAVSQPFTVTPCENGCDPAPAFEALAAWKQWAGGDLGNATTFNCIVGTVYDNKDKIQSGVKNFRAARKVGDWVEDQIEDKSELLGDIAEEGIGIIGFGVFSFAVPDFPMPPAYNDLIFGMAKDIVCKQDKMLDDIEADPPKDGYTVVTPPAIEDWPTTGDPLGDRLIESMEEVSAYGRAQLDAVEHYQGALRDGWTRYEHVQARAVADFGDALVVATRKMQRRLDALQKHLAATEEGSAPLFTAGDVAMLSTLFQRIRSSGFTASETAELEGLGLTPAMIEKYRSAYDVRIEDAPVGRSMAQVMGDLVDALETTEGPLQTLGNEAAHTAQINNAPPDASFDLSTSSGLAPLPVEFTDTSTDFDLDPLTVTWDFGDGTFGAGKTAAHTFTGSGVYTVTETVSDGYVTDTETHEVTVGAGAIRIRPRLNPEAGGSVDFAFGDGPVLTAPYGGDKTRGVAPGSYELTAGLPGLEADLTGLACDDGGSAGPSTVDLEHGTAHVEVEAGELVTCTFTWTRRAQLIVGQLTDPPDLRAHPQMFTYTREGAEPLETFHGQATSLSVKPGEYDVVQAPPPAEAPLSEIHCDDADSTVAVADRRATFRLDPGEAVNCTFTNHLHTGRLVIAEQHGSPARKFAFWNDGANVLTQLAAGETLELERLPGDYSFTQVAAAGWKLDTVACDDGGSAHASTTSLAHRRAVVRLDPDEVVHCTFTNVKVAPPELARGRVVATGHDADYHCMTSGGQTQCHFLERAIEYARAGSPHPEKPVLALDPSIMVSGALQRAFGTLDGDGVPVTEMAPQSELFADTPLDTDHYSAIVVASDVTCGGCTFNTGSSTPDSDALLARKTDFAEFFNDGGGIVALAGGTHGDGQGDDDTYYAFMPLPIGGVAVAAPFSLTPAGEALGFEMGTGRLDDINCCATHNSFQEPPEGSPLKVAEIDGSGVPETLFGEGTIVNGGIVDDTDAPVTTATVTPKANTAGWHKGDATVHLKADDGDGGVGVEKITWTVATAARTVTSGSSADLPVSAAGVTTVHFHATDKAGNAEAEKTFTVRIDRTAPGIAIASPAPGASVVAGTTLSARFACTDAGSGVAACSGSTANGGALPTATPGAFVLEVSATDKAGNAAALTRPWTVRAAIAPPPAPVAPAPPAPKPAPKEEHAVLGLSQSRRCVSRRKFVIRLREPRGDKLLSARVLVNGKRVKTLRGKRLKAPVNLTGLPKGRFKVKVIGRTRNGRTVSEQRRYRTCAKKRRK
jgi:PKD repeat protein